MATITETDTERWKSGIMLAQITVARFVAKKRASGQVRAYLGLLLE